MPKHEVKVFAPKKSLYCVCIPVINEGEKIQKQIKKLKAFTNIIDVIILDGGSSDGSLEDDFLKENNMHKKASLMMRLRVLKRCSMLIEGMRARLLS